MHFLLYFNVRVCGILFPFLFLPFQFWWLCACLYHRCCPGRRAAFSHTPSSIKTTQAVRMNWTSSSMEESSSSLFSWTLWVKCTCTEHSFCLAHLETHLTGGENWNINEGTGQWLVGDSRSDVCIELSLFALLWKLLLVEPKCSVEIAPVRQQVLLRDDFKKTLLLLTHLQQMSPHDLQIILFFWKTKLWKKVNPLLKQFHHSLSPLSFSAQLFPCRSFV